MKSFYDCSFFEEQLQETQRFEVIQNEIKLKNQLSDTKHLFVSEEIKYECIFFKVDKFDYHKPTIIICIKDDLELITVTHNNLKIHNALDFANLLVVDDRPSNNRIEQFAKDSGINYLSVNNSKGFNFSMLNNIASKLLYSIGNETVIFWNSDLWVPDSETLPRLVDKHKQHNSKLSGTKLIYPPQKFSINGSIDTENIKLYFPHMVGGKWRETIQFGGVSLRNLEPYHAYRFKSPDDPRVNFDGGCNMITGAFHIWDLETFIAVGGFNPSLSKNYQDNDISLRLVEKGIIPMYFGKNTFLYHDESPSLIKQGKQDQQIYSDHILFHKIWDKKLLSLL